MLPYELWIGLVHAAACTYQCRRLIASVGRVCYRPRRSGIAHRRRSLISTIALLCIIKLCKMWLPTKSKVIFTSPAGAVANYCDACVCMCVGACLSVCLAARISPEPHARSVPNFVHVIYGRGSILIQQGDEVPREETILGFWGFSSPIAMHCASYQLPQTFRCTSYHYS